MRLERLFDMELRFSESMAGGSIAASPDADVVHWSLGGGTVSGPRLRGEIKWSNRARRLEDGSVSAGPKMDGTWLPHFTGYIRTRDEAFVEFDFRGYNSFVGLTKRKNRRAISGSMTFLAEDTRYRGLNNVVAAVVGRGAWGVDEGPGDEDETWELGVYRCVNELAPAGGSRRPTRPGRSPVRPVARFPGLQPLFDASLRFGPPEDTHVPASGGDRDWVGYAVGDGFVVGPRLWGTVGWTNMPRRRADGTWLPHLRGFIRTEAGAPVLFDFCGVNVSLTSPFEYTHRTLEGTMTFRVGDPRYRWLNQVWSLVEGEVRQGKTELWTLRAHALGNPWRRTLRSPTGDETGLDTSSGPNPSASEKAMSP